jgi:diguanylate cyclase (GGDEF)-like protein
MGTAPGTAGDAAREEPRDEASDRAARAARRVVALSAGLVLASFALLMVAGRALDGFRDPFSTAVSLPWWVIALAFVAAGLLGFDIEIHREAHTFTFSEVPLVLGLLFTGPAGLLVGRLAGETAVLTLRERQSPMKLAFNLSVSLAECCAAIVVFRTLVGSGGVNSPRTWLAGAVAVLVADALGVIAVALAIRWHGERADVAGLAMTAAITAAANTSLALAAALLLWTNVWAVTLLVVVTAVLVLAYRGYTALAHRYASLSLFYDFTTTVAGSMRAELVLETILDKTRELLRADFAEIRVTSGDGRNEILRLASREGTPALADTVDALVPAPEAVAALVERQRVVVIPRGSRDDDHGTVLDRLDLRDAMVAPLTADGALIGTITVGDRVGEVATFDHESSRLFLTLANHASVALENGRLIDQLSREVTEREFQALHDALTGLPNRTAFLERIRQATHRPSARGFAVLLLDLDGFKDVNDTLGHERGDQLLVEVARRLARTIDDEATVARLGGDEFGILLPDAATEADAVAQAAVVRETVAQPYEIGAVTVASGGSIGIACWPEHASDVSTLLKRADVAMYDAKSSPTGIAAYHPDRDEHSVRRLSLAAELRQAIEREELQVYYQPKARLADGEIVGAEALLRWRHPEHGMVPPDEFVAIAERTGLIGALTAFVLRTAVDQCAIWRRDGNDLTVAVNLSVRNLLDLDLPGHLGRLLALSRVEPGTLTLEVTESTIMDPRRGIDMLERLAAMGVRLSIDDFGTGYSSLAYLQRLPVHELKVDRAFVMGIGADRNNAAIVRTIVDLGHNLGLSVVAEGVEDQVCWDALRAMGCDLAQGYALSRPIPPAAFDQWLRDRRTPVPPLQVSR